MASRTLASFVMMTAALLRPEAPALAAAPFYHGKTVTVFINFAAGGPTDIEGRFFARSIARHLDGSPTVIVQNMEGAGGMAGANYLGEIAPKDGSIIGYFSSVPWLYSVIPGERRIKLEKFEFLAYQPGTSINYMRTDVKPGMRDPTQIREAQDLVVGGLSQDNAKDVMMRLTLDMLGVKYKYVTAYPGSQGVRLALQRGEVNFYSESAPIYRSVVDPSFVKTGQVTPVYYDPGYDGDNFYTPKQVEGLNIPPFTDFYRQLTGNTPSGKLWESYLAALSVNNAMQRTVVMPPGSPPEALKAVQAAINDTQKDPQYVDEAQKLFGYVPDYVAEPGTNQQARKALYVRPEIRDFMRDYMFATRK